MDFSSNPALKISLHHFSMSISGTSLCNLSQYSFHTYESTQMANYASDCTELLCIIRNGSKFLSWEKVRSDSIRLVDLWAWGGQLVCPLSVRVVLQHRHVVTLSCRECKQGIRRRCEVQGRRRCVAAKSAPEELGTAEGGRLPAAELRGGAQRVARAASEQGQGEAQDTNLSPCNSS